MSRRILILFAHPALEKSRVNRRLIAAAQELPGVTVRDLYELYPDLEVDVAAEQAALLEHEVIVFQHPFYWYSAPPIVKQWQDLVLEHGWAYGTHGTKLAGKITLNAVTAGGPEAAYQSGAYNRFTVRQLLAPFEQTANLCRMRYLAPFVVHGALKIQGPEQVDPHLADYRAILGALHEDRLDLERAAAVSRLNADLSALVRS